MMLGHQKGQIAMLEARLKHVLNVQHEAATRLSIDGQHVEVISPVTYATLVSGPFS